MLTGVHTGNHFCPTQEEKMKKSVLSEKLKRAAETHEGNQSNPYLKCITRFMRFQPLVQNLLLNNARTLVWFFKNARTNPHEIFRVCAGRHKELAIKNEHNRSLALLTHLLAPHCSLRSSALPRLFVGSLNHSLQSSREKKLCLNTECVNFIQFQPTVRGK